jgi:hypothetical protein
MERAALAALVALYGLGLAAAAPALALHIVRSWLAL